MFRCFGDSQSFNVPEPTTGCGIVQGGGKPYVFGTGSALGFANTGFFTTYKQGDLIEMTTEITAYHGGILGTFYLTIYYCFLHLIPY
jgi:hypothetical protein